VPCSATWRPAAGSDEAIDRCGIVVARRRPSSPDVATDGPVRRGDSMAEHRIFTTAFSSVYPLYVQKAERKGRTKDEVDRVICWLTGYGADGLQQQLHAGSDFRTFFAEAPALHPNSAAITGVVCGVRVEEVADPLMQKIRWLDKLVDELAKGKAMDKILRR
jgi:hypothetical protein